MGRTGIVRDNLFLQHKPGPWHPESPERLEAVYRMLDSRDQSRLTFLPGSMASPEDITLIHKPSYYLEIVNTAGQEHCHLDADTSTSPLSFEAASSAAGGLIDMVRMVLDGELDNGFALVRPPGHHAEAVRAMGFCIFNNVAVAAAWARKNRGLSRILIVDWDIHHGNGTQHSFYDDPQVFYISLHQSPLFPGTGSVDEIGRGAGKGYNVNIPLAAGRGDGDYLAVFRHLILPLARLYRPELILVSAGFDTYRMDPLGGMMVSLEGFAAMARLLKDAAEEICHERIVLTLEGGYHIQGQADAVGLVLDVLTGTGSANTELAEENFPEPGIIARVKFGLRNHWSF